MRHDIKIKTRVFFITVITIATFIIIILGCGPESGEKDAEKPDETTGESDFQYNVTADIEDFPEDTMEIVTLSLPVYDKDYAAETALRFGLSGTVEEINGVYSIKDGKSVYSLDSLTGIENFGNPEAGKWDNIEEPQIPSEEEATGIAIEFINSLRESGSREIKEGLYSKSLLIVKPDTAIKVRELEASTTALVPVQVNEIMRSAVEVNDELEPGKEIINAQVVSRTVVFNKYYLGKPVFVGPGSRVSVTIGHNGKVLRFNANWFPISTEESRAVKVIEGEKAVKALETKLRKADTKNTIKNVNVKAMFPGYISATVDGEYTLVPAYYFDCESEFENDNVFSFSEIIVAAPELEGKIEMGFDIPVPDPPKPIKEKPGE
ncbi:MAG: hypothetical protein JSW52_01875 [Candidatus Coatesbacteria bacterium]|nr:MAG: hypothetical protein JSW52_01875 [Candidatus Coatesbacteria bacterium]